MARICRRGGMAANRRGAARAPQNSKRGGVSARRRMRAWPPSRVTRAAAPRKWRHGGIVIDQRRKAAANAGLKQKSRIRRGVKRLQRREEHRVRQNARREWLASAWRSLRCRRITKGAKKAALMARVGESLESAAAASKNGDIAISHQYISPYNISGSVRKASAKNQAGVGVVKISGDIKRK